MKRPILRPILGVTVGLVMCAGTAAAAAAPEPENQAPEKKPGWVSRVAAGSKKLAFWDKEKKPAEAAPAAPPPAAATPKKSGAARAETPAKPAKPVAAKPPAAKKASAPSAPAPEPAPEPPPAVEPEKKSFFQKLPALPSFSWRGRREPADAAAVDAAVPAGSASKKQEVAEVKKEAEAKPSLWSRVAAAVTPAAPGGEKPPTTPVPKGLAPLGVTAPDSSTFVITKDDSPFYSFGPQQATPPDAYLATGTVVTLTGKSWGWATVQLPDGRSGMVDRTALRQALITDLIPSKGLGGSDPLMASLSPNQRKRSPSPNFVLPAAEMPDLPTSGDAGAAAANPLLLPFSPDDGSAAGDFPPLPEIQPLPEPDSPEPAAPEPAAPEPAAPEPAAPEPAAPEPAAPEPAAPDQQEPAEGGEKPAGAPDQAADAAPGPEPSEAEPEPKAE